MDWLADNAYAKQQVRSGRRMRAVVYMLVSLFTGYVAYSLGKEAYHVVQADSGITVEGYVENYRDAFKMRRTRINVSMEYQGKLYTVRNKGYHFQRGDFEEAVSSRRVTVYVNPKSPVDSVLSLGVPRIIPVIIGLVCAVSCGFLAFAVSNAWLYFRGDEKK